MDINLKYIEDNYIELEKLAELTHFKTSEIEKFILEKQIPSHSYAIHSEIKIVSSLNDSHFVSIEKKYFSKNVLSLLKDLKAAENNSEEIKKRFRENFVQRLLNHNTKEFAYQNLFDENNHPDEERLNVAFDEEWNHYNNGIYGICTLNASENDIIDKEIIVKKLIKFNQEKGNRKLTESEKEELKNLNAEFNQSTALFAPYQRETSSRGKYLDKILNENGLSELVKKY
ncbi:DUF6058 family natural product biosynthesis protein [Flavobacterium poyangense]|uniref:DUF6058 family natural product biosynthesis protein n=1 Tax=Flavobacterium poyangense TaxID=2204302 RepID=UPI0014241B47|nr:DUF6058 family natural product biosynthesis protein [Flavobacterium sp. JXAS1]